MKDPRDVPPVPLRSLPSGARFTLPWSGREGSVIRHGPGSSMVELARYETKTFTPATGRNAGKEVSIGHTSERTHISLDTMVAPCSK